jgi:hypothetical protein
MTQDAAAIWRRIAQALKVHSNRELGEKLGRAPATIAQRKSDKTVAREHILYTALKTGCRLEWLETGEEPIYAETVRLGDLAAPVAETVRLVVGASESAQAALLRIARCLAPLAQVTERHPIMNGVIAAEYHARIEAEWKTDTPDSPAD